MRLRSRTTLLIVAALALFALQGAADAATVQLEPSGVLVVTGDPGTSSKIFAKALGPPAYDRSVEVSVGGSESLSFPPLCAPSSGNGAICDGTDVSSVRIDAGDASDFVAGQNSFAPYIPIEANGELGRDRISINQNCFGCVANGGDDADKIAICLCDGIVHGGEGSDQISTRAVRGAPTFDAFAGVKSTIYGEGGNDKLEGTKGQDTIDGGPGNDRIVGGKGFDTMFGGEGRDTLFASDGVSGNDNADCGTNSDGSREHDFARIDVGLPGDYVFACESVTTPH